MAVQTVGDVLNLVRRGHIEMYMSVLTHPRAPFAVHIGIQRSFRYALNLATDRWQAFGIDLQKHSGQSITLHSFAARTILSRASPASKLYMLTAPTATMNAILHRALPYHTYEEDMDDSPIRSPMGSPIRVENRNGFSPAYIELRDAMNNIVFEHNRIGEKDAIANNETIANEEMNWLYHPYMAESKPPGLSYTLVDYAPLAANF